MKAIFQGRDLSNSIKNEDGKLAVAKNIDPFREWGFLKPAYTGTTINENWSGYIKDMAFTNTILALSEDYKIYSINTLHNTATKVHDTPANLGTYKLCAYQTNIGSSINSRTIFYFYGDTAGLYDGTNFTDNWMGTIPAGATSLGYFAKPYVWQNFMMIAYTTASSNYIAKFDGATGANGTLTTSWFDIGSNWEVVSFFSYYNYLGVVVRNSYSYNSQILLLDGSSTSLPVKRIAVSDNINNSFNINNDVFFVTNNGIKQLGDNGLESGRDLYFEDPNTIGSIISFNGNISDKLNDTIYFLGTRVRSFRRKDINNSYIISDLYDYTGANALMIKGISSTGIFVSSYTGGTYYLQYFSTGNAAATLKYPFKDIGQQGIVKYVKFFFKPLASGDSITLGLDTDYGTSETLGTATFATDGAITSKRFEIKKPCHAFRPTVQWVSGGTSISYVEVEYELTSDI